MKTLVAASLLIFGAIWSFFAFCDPVGGQSRAISHAMSFEAELRAWFEDKQAEGKLSEEDYLQVFDEASMIRFGGEGGEGNFRAMILQIADDEVLPKTPGVLAMLIGLAGLLPFNKMQNKPKQGDPSQRPC